MYTRTFMAIEEQAHEMGYEIIVAQTLNNPEREETCIRRLLARQVDGLFIRPVYRADSKVAIYEELRKLQTPTVILGHRALFCNSFPNVETNDMAAAKAITEHLLDLCCVERGKPLERQDVGHPLTEGRNLGLDSLTQPSLHDELYIAWEVIHSHSLVLTARTERCASDGVYKCSTGC